jgi:anti-anti-sigma factor
MILTGLKACRQAGGDLRIAAAQPGVANILNIAGFTSVLKIYDQIELAVSSFGEN